jgi:hypothetical protein
MKERRKEESVESKIGWYYRHWKSMGLDKDVSPTYSVQDWNEQCSLDPLINKPNCGKRKPGTNEETC